MALQRDRAGPPALETPAPPEVSVILPVRNRVRLVEAAARCVLDQTWRDLELILVDGGSTDGTVDVLLGLERADPRVRLLLNDHPEGVSAARNAGARLARGRWLAFQDSDDVWHPEKLTAQMEALCAMPAARAAYTGVRRTLPEGTALRPPDWNGLVDGAMHPRLLAESLVTTPALVVERALFEDLGGFDERLRHSEDWDLVVRVSARTPLACAKDWLVDSSRLPDSLTNDRNAQLDALALLLAKHEPFLAPYPEVHERRLAEAGVALLVSGRGGWPLLRRALAIRPVSLHGPVWRAAGGLVSRRVRRWTRRREAAG